MCVINDLLATEWLINEKQGHVLSGHNSVSLVVDIK